MRVLVTGWAGYIGPVLVRRLREAGHYVIGWDTGFFLPNFVEPPTWPDMVRFVDIRDAHLWPDRVDAVVHLAGLSNDPMGALDPDLTYAVNTHGTEEVVATLRKARHVIVSSCSVYGATKEIATETTLPAPLTIYAATKALVDAEMHGTEADPYANAVSLRLGTVYGFSPGHRLDLVVNRMVWDALNEGIVTATGSAARPLVHVEDVADAVLFMLDRPETGIYNVVGENVRMHDLARTIAKFDLAHLSLEPSGADARDYMASGDKLAALGFTPSRRVETSLHDLFEQTSHLAGDRSRYERLPALNRLLQSGYLTSDLRPKERIAA